MYRHPLQGEFLNEIGILVVSLPLSVTVKYTVVAIKVPFGPPVELHEEEPELMFWMLSGWP